MGPCHAALVLRECGSGDPPVFGSRLHCGTQVGAAGPAPVHSHEVPQVGRAGGSGLGLPCATVAHLVAFLSFSPCGFQGGRESCEVLLEGCWWHKWVLLPGFHQDTEGTRLAREQVIVLPRYFLPPEPQRKFARARTPHPLNHQAACSARCAAAILHGAVASLVML